MVPVLWCNIHVLSRFTSYVHEIFIAVLLASYVTLKKSITIYKIFYLETCDFIAFYFPVTYSSSQQFSSRYSCKKEYYKKESIGFYNEVETAGSLFFFPRNYSRDYEERLSSLKENGTRHGRSTHETRLLPHSAIPLCLTFFAIRVRDD